MAYTLSVVIPAYNSEKTLPETIDCILGQSLHNEIQLIIVNDGSTDSTPDIMKSYSEKNENIICIDKENGGVSSARNRGIKEASGRYLMFLDADDLLSPASCENICCAMDERKADIGLFRITRFGWSGNETNPVAESLSAEKTISKFDKRLLWNFLYINKCYRTEYIRENGYEFPPIRYCEDGAFFMNAVMNSDPVITGINSAEGLYRKSDPLQNRSVTQSIRKELLEDYDSSCSMILENINKALSFPGCPVNDREDYLQEFCYKVCHTYINEFYRKIWHADNDVIKLMEENYGKYYSLLNEENRKKTVQDDIGSPVFSKEELAKEPYLSVLVDNPSEDFIKSVYEQSMMRFEIITDNAGNYTFENIRSGKPLSSTVIKLNGNEIPDPRLFRAVMLIKEKAPFLPPALLKTAAEKSISVKDMIRK